MKEVESYLRRKGFEEKELVEVIEKLKSWHYLDDSRVALQWAKYKVASAFWGPVRLQGELTKRGVDREIVAEVLQRLEEEFPQREIAKKALSKYLRTHRTGGAFGPARLSAYLQRKGFPEDTVNELVQEGIFRKQGASSEESLFKQSGAKQETTVSEVLEDHEGS